MIQLFESYNNIISTIIDNGGIEISHDFCHSIENCSPAWIRLNDDKTEFNIIGTRQQLAKVNIDSMQVGESSIAPTNRVKNLGCWFDGQLKMDTQKNSFCKTTFFHLYNYRRIRKFLNFGCTKILVNAF